MSQQESQSTPIGQSEYELAAAEGENNSINHNPNNPDASHTNQPITTNLKKRRRKRVDEDGRNFTCSCGKSYLSYPALYTHVKTKHNGELAVGKGVGGAEEGIKGERQLGEGIGVEKRGEDIEKYNHLYTNPKTNKNLMVYNNGFMQPHQFIDPNSIKAISLEPFQSQPIKQTNSNNINFQKSHHHLRTLNTLQAPSPSTCQSMNSQHSQHELYSSLARLRERGPSASTSASAFVVQQSLQQAPNSFNNSHTTGFLRVPASITAAEHEEQKQRKAYSSESETSNNYSFNLDRFNEFLETHFYKGKAETTMQNMINSLILNEAERLYIKTTKKRSLLMVTGRGDNEDDEEEEKEEKNEDESQEKSSYPEPQNELLSEFEKELILASSSHQAQQQQGNRTIKKAKAISNPVNVASQENPKNKTTPTSKPITTEPLNLSNKMDIILGSFLLDIQTKLERYQLQLDQLSQHYHRHHHQHLSTLEQQISTTTHSSNEGVNKKLFTFLMVLEYFIVNLHKFILKKCKEYCEQQPSQEQEEKGESQQKQQTNVINEERNVINVNVVVGDVVVADNSSNSKNEHSLSHDSTCASEILIEWLNDSVTYFLSASRSDDVASTSTSSSVTLSPYIKQPIVICKLVFFLARWMYQEKYTDQYVEWNVR